MTLKLCSIAAALALAFASGAQAQMTPKDTAKADRPSADRKVKNAEEDRIEAEYKSAKAKCDVMKGNEKEVCEADAKGKEKVAKAELDAQKNPSARNQQKVDEAKAEHKYNVAKEKCDALKGKEEDACEKQAKAEYDKAKADIKKQFAQRKDADKPARSATSGGTASGAAGGTAK
jgi:hypothetical protein